MTQKYRLNQVFGYWQDSNAPTYVDRAGLDSEFEYLLSSSKLIVIHGEPRQGKTILRKKHLEEAEIVRINCTTTTTGKAIRIEILRQLGIRIVKEYQHTKARGNRVEGQLGAEFVVKGQATIEKSNDDEIARTFQVIGDPEDVNFLIEQWHTSPRPIVIEDFHFLSDIEQVQFASDLKALTDNGVQFIIIGVWEEASRLSTFQSQLRVQEITIEWSAIELRQVLRQGEKALNISISDEIRREIVKDANGNVGLLQSVVEAFCFASGIRETQPKQVQLSEMQKLLLARQRICQQELQPRFTDALRRIADGKKQSTVRMYEKILRAVMTLSDDVLLRGVKPGKITKTIEALGIVTGDANQGHVTQTIARINDLQSQLMISPPIFFYDSGSRELRLVDRAFLFFRKYKNVPYPWEQDADEED